MSHARSAQQDKYQKLSKVHFQQYLTNLGEPKEYLVTDITSDREAQLLDDSNFMRRRIRHIAQELRNHYS